MDCSCGCTTRGTKAERTKLKAVLHYQECPACGRCDMDALFIAGARVATGIEAQRQFNALEVPPGAVAGTRAKPDVPPLAASRVVDAVAVAEPEPEKVLDWQLPSQTPPQQTLVKVEFINGGSSIAHASYFTQSWDLISRWAVYDNGPALRRSFVPVPIPRDLRVSTLADEPAASPRKTASVVVTAPPVPKLMPVGANLAFDF